VDFEDNFLVSTVKDTGIGMSNEDLTQLFKFFGQISKSKDINRGGMGLGLTISKMISQQMQGTI
jgi:signal transduction histidine kinase